MRDRIHDTRMGIWLILAAVFSGCATIQSSTVSEIQRGPGHRISAEDTAHGFFMVSMPDLDAAAKLKAQCAGTVTGVQNILWVRNWFFVVQHYHHELAGWCQNN